MRCAKHRSLIGQFAGVITVRRARRRRPERCPPVSNDDGEATSAKRRACPLSGPMRNATASVQIPPERSAGLAASAKERHPWAVAGAGSPDSVPPRSTRETAAPVRRSTNARANALRAVRPRSTVRTPDGRSDRGWECDTRCGSRHSGRLRDACLQTSAATGTPVSGLAPKR